MMTPSSRSPSRWSPGSTRSRRRRGANSSPAATSRSPRSPLVSRSPGARAVCSATPRSSPSPDVGRKRALEMALDGDPIDAATAAMGPDQPGGARRRARRRGRRSHRTGARGARCPRPSASGCSTSRSGSISRKAYEIAVERMASAATIADAQEGFAAFLEKRHPKFDAESSCSTTLTASRQQLKEDRWRRIPHTYSSVILRSAARSAAVRPPTYSHTMARSSSASPAWALRRARWSAPRTSTRAAGAVARRAGPGRRGPRASVLSPSRRGERPVAGIVEQSGGDVARSAIGPIADDRQPSLADQQVEGVDAAIALLLAADDGQQTGQQTLQDDAGGERILGGDDHEAAEHPVGVVRRADLEAGEASSSSSEWNCVVVTPHERTRRPLPAGGSAGPTRGQASRQLAVSGGAPQRCRGGHARTLTETTHRRSHRIPHRALHPPGSADDFDGERSASRIGGRPGGA